MGEVKKRQHYVPRFYLRGFARGEQIGTVMLNGPRQFTQSVATAGSELHFHTVPGHPQGEDAFEDMLSDVEGAAAATFRRIFSGVWPLPPHERTAFAEFLALQAVRGAEHRRTMTFLAAQTLRAQIGSGGKKRLRKRMEQILGSSGVDDKLVDALWDQATGPAGPPVALTPWGHIQQIADLVEAIAPLMERRPWVLYRFDGPALITSDSPVVLVPEIGAAPSTGLGFGTAGMVTFPLDRCTGLLMYQLSPPESAERVFSGEADLEDAGSNDQQQVFNFYTVGASSEALFYHPEDEGLIPDDLPLPRPVSARVSGIPDAFPG